MADTPLNRLRVADMAHDIENWGGHAWVFLATPLAGIVPLAIRPQPISKQRHR